MRGWLAPMVARVTSSLSMYLDHTALFVYRPTNVMLPLTLCYHTRARALRGGANDLSSTHWPSKTLFLLRCCHLFRLFLAAILRLVPRYVLVWAPAHICTPTHTTAAPLPPTDPRPRPHPPPCTPNLARNTTCCKRAVCAMGCTMALTLRLGLLARRGTTTPSA